MSVAVTYSSAQLGIDAPLVTVEVDVSPGLPQVLIVGLPETAVRESKDRIRAAFRSSGLKFPDKRVTVNLAPADLPKSSGRYDLAIAVAILVADGAIRSDIINQHEFLGELSLTGKLRRVNGILPAAIRNGHKHAEPHQLIVPASNADEAALASDSHVLTSSSLREVVDYLNEGQELQAACNEHPIQAECNDCRLSEIRGQHAAKRALMIAAAGEHNLLMTGPPGTGKSMLANRLPSLVPPMSTEEALELASIISVSNSTLDTTRWRQRPFRSPHHTASAVALVGGSRPPKPGEISLAHHGFLFLDELPEFPRRVLEVLREPLESREILLSRAGQQVKYPARFQLVAAMNPCPCGYLGDDQRVCECNAAQIERYRNRLSGPFLDRIDLHIEVPRVPQGVLSAKASSTEDSTSRARVLAAIEAAKVRQGFPNARLEGAQLDNSCALDQRNRRLLEKAVTKLGISARGYFKVIKVARTIADLDGREEIGADQLLEALSYRSAIGTG